ncbi:hypothetical protein Aple_006160 [Acrocarpospora pleiomorpha]|uniref:Uncharacterized protein n=1 Tax=Acrocarpospora pleiomorpha TaxID=90975 RepID=A0A5M3XDT7_9ACTN|nr:hypothetical protein Aple_006160 [Acrocarpospora pleiomorpha]
MTDAPSRVAKATPPSAVARRSNGTESVAASWVSSPPARTSTSRAPSAATTVSPTGTAEVSWPVATTARVTRLAAVSTVSRRVVPCRSLTPCVSATVSPAPQPGLK